MAENVNIKNLDTATQIVAGDYLIVETSTGTKIVDYKNLIIGTTNITFANTLSALAADIADRTTLIKQLTGSDTANTAIVASVSGLSGLEK